MFVPGPLDITVNSTLPRRPLLASLTGKLKTKIPKVHFATNPCRIKFFDQEIVIFREDLMARILRNVVGVKPDVKSEDLKRFVRVNASFYDMKILKLYNFQLVQSILDQSHLSPLTIDIQPVLSDYDHSLRLYPLPTTVSVRIQLECSSCKPDFCHSLFWLTDMTAIK